MSLARAMPAEAESLHDRDFYTWTQNQAELLRAGRFAEIDIANLIEEIEDLGENRADAFEAAYRLICSHLLKLIYQPTMATPSWRSTIGRERINLERILRKNPGLKSKRDELVREAYADARREARVDTGLPLKVFPVDPPFTRQQVEDEDFWP